LSFFLQFALNFFSQKYSNWLLFFHGCEVDDKNRNGTERARRFDSATHAFQLFGQIDNTVDQNALRSTVHGKLIG